MKGWSRMRSSNSGVVYEQLESRRLFASSTSISTYVTWVDSSTAEFESVDYSAGPAGVVTHVSVGASVNVIPNSTGDPVATITIKVFDNNTNQQTFFASGFSSTYNLNVASDLLSSHLQATMNL